MAFGKLVANVNCIEASIAKSLEAFPKDSVNNAPDHVSVETISRLVSFYNTYIVDSKAAGGMGTFFTTAEMPSILALERFRSTLVKTSSSMAASITNQAVLRLLDTPTHSLSAVA